jgi:hypothetical protein
MKLRYGGFDARQPYSSDGPWLRLKTIAEYLEDGEPIPPQLAQWLGEAITYSGEDPAELLRRLGLKRRRGRQPHKHAENSWLIWGERICQLESQYRREGRENAREQALADVATEYGDVERSTLQTWRDTYEEHSSCR